MEDRIAIGIIGAGQIGSAIAGTLARTGRYAVSASRTRTEALAGLADAGVHVTADNREVAERSQVVFLAVKPYKVAEVLGALGDALAGRILVSVAAAIPLSILGRCAPAARRARAMPNIALVVGESFTAWTDDGSLMPEDERLVGGILGEMGTAMRVDEGLLNAVTALSGSGPAYVATLIEAMAYAGLKVGLPRDFAYASSAQTVLGTARLVLEKGWHPAQVKEMVLTPAGTTIEGIFYLEESGMRTALMKAVEAATRRADEIERKLGGG